MYIKFISLMLAGLMMINQAQADWGGYHERQKYHRYISFMDDIEAQQKMQRRRIKQGVSYGEFSRSELKRLRREQNRIEEMICRFDQDRRFSKYERRKIRKLLERADTMIWEFRHNRTFAKGHYKRRNRRNKYPYEYAENRDYTPTYRNEYDPFSGKVIIKW